MYLVLVHEKGRRQDGLKTYTWYSFLHKEGQLQRQKNKEPFLLTTHLTLLSVIVQFPFLLLSDGNGSVGRENADFAD